jgi:uncharacterized protein (TIGR03437 family)
LPAAAWADLTGIVVLGSNQTLNLETGGIGISGGDLFWNGATLTPQGKAVAFNVTGAYGFSGPDVYANLTQSNLLAYGSLASQSPIGSLVTGSVLAARDISGNYAKLLVTGVTGTSIEFQYDTYGANGSGNGGSNGPVIGGVQNAYSYLVPGVPNYGIAPGSLFIITGTAMATSATPVLQSSNGSGIPVTLNGASISVDVNNFIVHPGIYYATATQIAAVLPASTHTGTGTITVTVNGTPSEPAPITVLPTAMGLDTVSGNGAGLAVATDPGSGALFSYSNSASPGKSIVLWGSGLGANIDSDTVFTSSPHAVSTPLSVYIGGIAATVLYAGRSAYPGLDQINVTIPASVQPGCGVSVVAVSGAIASNSVTIPVAAAGGPCSDPVTGVSGAQLATLGGKSSFHSGSVSIFETTASGQPMADVAQGVFLNNQGAQAASGTGLISLGSCVVTSSALGAAPLFSQTGLDPGSISITGPLGSEILLPASSAKGSYQAQMTPGFLPATGGSFTFQTSGGADVGAFKVPISYANPLSWTNSSNLANITRSSGANISWTGGASNSFVAISGASTTSAVTASFSCYAPASAHQFAIPSYVLQALPTGIGTLTVSNQTTPVPFTASGLDVGLASAGVSFSISSLYQ